MVRKGQPLYGPNLCLALVLAVPERTALACDMASSVAWSAIAERSDNDRPVLNGLRATVSCRFRSFSLSNGLSSY